MLVVVARCPDGVRQFVVPTGAPGVRIEPQESIDMVKSYARVVFTGVEVDGVATVGPIDQSSALIDRQTAVALVLERAR